MLDANNYDSLLPIVKYGHPIQRALILDDEGKIVEDEIDDDTTITKSEELSNGRKCFNFICGIEHQEFEGENIKSGEDMALEASEFLQEESKYKR